MPTFYNFRENGLDYSFDDIFVPADLFRTGNLWVWGNPSISDSLATGDSLVRSTPTTTLSNSNIWKTIESNVNLNARTVTAIKSDGTLWCWGNGSLGGVGNGLINGNVSTPVTTFAGGTNWKQSATGYRSAAAIKTDGTLWIWGSTGNGRLGDGVTASGFSVRSTPITTFAGGTNWKQVASSNRNFCAIKTDGTLWCWGDNQGGQLGNADTIDASTPVTTFAGGTDWKTVFDTGLAIKTDGTLWVWGLCNNGELGNGVTTGFVSTPITTFAGGTNWKQASRGANHMVAIKTDGTLWAWGATGSGRLGGNSITGGTRSTPVTTFAGGTNWKQASAGSSHAAAIKTDGTLWVWGNGANSQLGNGTSINGNLTPITTFAGGTNWKLVVCGPETTFALTYEDPVI